MNIPIAYEDSSLIIFDKPQGLATAPGTWKSLTDIVFQSYPKLSEVKGYKNGEGGLLNRLDNETGGLVVFAKNNEAFSYYSAQMKNEKVIKTYQAFTEGRVEETSGAIRYPIAHHAKSSKKMVIVKKREKYRGKPQEAETRWRLIRYEENYSVLLVEITKGVRHQIRIHLSEIDHPIVNDKIYSKTGKCLEKIPFHLLYACGLEFMTPEGETKKVNVKAPFDNL